LTLILGTVFRRAAVQVTDRLVTLTDPPGAPHDPIANKSVICCTSDGLFAVSYSGPAYIDKVTTTDTWLATTLWGEALPKQSFLAGAARGRMIDIGATLIRLREALQKTYDRLPRSHPSFYVSAVGVQKGRLPRVAAYEIKDRSPSGPHVFEISKAPRDIPKDKFVLLQSPGGLLPEEEENLRREIRDCRSVDNVEEALVRTIRLVSDRNSLVGADCMSIAIAAMLDPNCRARFIPRAAHQRVLGEGSFAAHGGIQGQWQGTPVQIGFSPYILGRSGIHFPSEMVGSGTLTLGDLSVSLDAPDPGVPRFAVRSQDRKGPP
jgi:hypothetical protein